MDIEQATKGIEGVITSQKKTSVRIRNSIKYRTASDIYRQPSYCLIPKPEKVTIVVHGEYVCVTGTINAKNVCFLEQWWWASKHREIVGSFRNLYSALNTFREAHSSYLDNINPTDILNNLQNLENNQPYDWENPIDSSDLEHQKIWNEVEISDELRQLAYYGYELYEGFFPKDSELRNLLNSLKPGSIIEFIWLPSSASEWLSHVPWGLMFQQPLPDSGEPINPLNFIGLRYRIEYKSHDPKGKLEALGFLHQTNRIHYLYWGETAEEIVPEVKWQRNILSSTWQNQEFVPNPDSTNPKIDILKSLKAPTPTPANLLYLYCFCDIGQGNTPVLRFGDNNANCNVVLPTDISQELLQDRPIVFANACTTLASSPDMANDLEKLFFKRGCGAYLGTEGKVPIKLASCFAMIFFHFFYRTVHPDRVVAGEAVIQTKLFLWQHYKNIGGFFYSYVGPYGLYVGS